MRLLHVALAAIVLVCGSANADPMATDSQLTNSEVAAMARRLTGEANAVPIQRFLRNGNADDDEERAASTSVLKALPSIKKVDNAALLKKIDQLTAKNMQGLTTSLRKTQLQDTLHNMNMEILKKTKLSLNDAFKFLNLDKDIKTLLSNPNLKTWVDYMETLPRRKTATPMIDTFRANFKDADLLQAFKAAQKSTNPTIANLGKSLEKSLVNKLRLERMRNGH